MRVKDSLEPADLYPRSGQGQMQAASDSLPARIGSGLFSLFSSRALDTRLTVLLFHKIPCAADPLTPTEPLLAQFEHTLDFLHKLATGALLSPASTKLLLRLMTNTETGVHRLKAGLPVGARLAHKTGTAYTDLGLTPAVNDIGVVTLPTGRHIAVAAFLTGSVDTEGGRDALFADAARLIFASYSR